MIVIIDYGMGNVGSIQNMLKRVGARATISGDIEEIDRAEKLVLPGVGAFDNGMQKLERLGLLPVLNRKVLVEKTPVLGVCLGMQLLTRSSEEGSLPGLGWVDADTIRFRFEPGRTDLKVPHMGWNSLRKMRTDGLFTGMGVDCRFYFVHSFHVVCDDDANVAATSFHGYEFTASVVKNNVFGTQFHPEKSHKFGMKIYENFSRF